MDARGDSQLQDFAERQARPHQVGGQFVDLAKAAIDDLEPVFGIEEAQALRHISERRVKAHIGRGEFFLLVLHSLISLQTATDPPSRVALWLTRSQRPS